MLQFQGYSLSSTSCNDPYAQWDSLVDPIDENQVIIEEPDFECRICLEVPMDPCVTRCGHLYCVDCLRQWLDFSPKCPACKTPSAMSQVVPIFGTRSSCRPPTSSPPSLHKVSLPTPFSPSIHIPHRTSTHSSSSPSISDVLDSESRLSRLQTMLRNRIQTFTPSEPSSPLSASSDAVLSASSQDDRLLPSRPIRFTTSPQTSRHNAVSRADEALQDTSEADTAGWDTDEELEYQLNQIAALKLSNNLTSLTTPQSQAPQRFSRALRLVALGLVLTVLLK